MLDFLDFFKESPYGACLLNEDLSIRALTPDANLILGFSADESLVGKSFLKDISWLGEEKLKTFIEQVKCGILKKRHWEISISRENKEIPLIIWGKKYGSMYCILIQQSSDEGLKLQNVIMDINTEMTNLHRELNRKQMALEKANEQIQKMNRELKERNERMEKELLMAQAVQKSLLSKIVNQYDKIHLHSKYMPADSIGGDLFDMMILDENHAGLFICDVMGHGVASALVMTVLKNIFQTHASKFRDPHAFLNIANKDFYHLFDRTDSEIFATAFYVIIDLKNKQLKYSGAGHPAPQLYRRNGEKISLDSPSFPIGMVDHEKYTTESIQLLEGDRLFLYTDGLECFLDNAQYQDYDLKRFSWGTIKTYFKAMSEALEKGSHLQKDDVCMLILEYKDEEGKINED